MKEKYEEMVMKHQFGEEDVPSYYHYSKEKYCPSKKAMIRIMTENQSLRSSLPVNWDTSILMRISNDCMNYSSVFITGPEGTPYHNGIFEFHMYYPNNYPTSNPKINLMTTGNGSVRFNPNLYNSGKVCLSLLGTWRGEQGESWNPELSTTLQLLISIQSLIFIQDPYFNEPGWERKMGTAIGNRKSFEYKDNIRYHNFRVSIINQYKNPPEGFEDFTRQHIIIKRDEIIKTVTCWIEESKNGKQKMIELLDEFKSLTL